MLGKTLAHFLFKAADNTPLVLFRVLFGFLLFCEAAGALATGWVDKVFIDCQMTIPFLGFNFLAETLHGPIMYGWYVALGIFGIGVMLGYKYRLSMALFAIFWTCTYLSQKTHYNNHYYLMVVLSWVMCFIPAHKYFSLDARRRRGFQRISCPNWCYVLLIGLLAIVYFFASINKLYPDWLNAVPAKMWFKAKGHYPIIGGLLKKEWMPWLISYGGIIFDGLIVPALLWRKTRNVAFAIGVLFHIANSIIFQIGVFPYMMIVYSILFFSPELLNRIFFTGKVSVEKGEMTPIILWKQYLLVFFLLLNILLPLRHHFIPGDVLYTEEGHRMSWRMMLRSKQASISIYTLDRDGKRQRYPIENYLTLKQRSKIGAHPDMLYWFIQKMKEWNPEILNKKIIVQSTVTVNGKTKYYPYDESTDFAKVTWSHRKHNDWVQFYKNDKD